MFFPPKYVKFSNGLIALEPQSGAHRSIVSKFPQHNPESAGFVSINRDGYRFSGQSVTLNLSAEADTTFDGSDLFYVFVKDCWGASRSYQLNTVVNRREDAVTFAEDMGDSLVYAGTWKEVNLPEFSIPVRVCIPTADDVLSADFLARELRSFFSEEFPATLFEPAGAVKEIYVLLVSHNLGMSYKEVHRCDSLEDSRLKELMESYAVNPHDQRVCIEKRSINSDGTEINMGPLFHSTLGVIEPREKSSMDDMVGKLREKFCR